MGFFKKNKKGSFNRNFEKDVKMDRIILSGTFFKCCENDLVIKNKLENLVPYFNGRIFLENKEEIGKVDEILGPINEFYFSVKLKEGILAKSFSSDTQFFIDQSQTIPISKFLPQEKIEEKKKKKKKIPNRDKKNNNPNSTFKKPNNFSFGGQNRNDRGSSRNSGGGVNNYNSGNQRGGGKTGFRNRLSGGRKFGNQRGRF
ncbi:H/ACA ribonucleoprotein complex subunit 1, putative (GAR1) [Plasmodium ovale wallikeri]|uniref:H/ACA ribonucleoprotein complex subunit n=2 Tax=Plasmodium ovale TaxID=36330 RepID=A0A1A8ZUX2_PLAOA|nr:H/ACA ribonucleoprotein complex subunit 1, putative (GAR1) [Plasmodium ovale wallikeri]SBT47639.1 H/ACA ribonucleoprotein complex subunit 1, putative (GAR1) [Plasmodium ovale wallikeri]SBT82261.1 H/ACA ribonucleoprotein complex subunit 1, putative [Plasmodium ovale]